MSAEVTSPEPTRTLVVVAAGLIAGSVLLVGCAREQTRAPGGGSGFQDRAREAGIAFRMHDLPKEQGERFRINLYDHGSGLAVGDYDNDGHEDIYFLDQHGPNALYRNTGDGSFVDVTAQAGVALGDRISVAATFADYDNDGWPDLFVTSTRGGNVLFHNRGDGTFEDVTAKAGLSHVGHSQTPVFFDYDNDGYRDLFLTNTAHWTTTATARSASGPTCWASSHQSAAFTWKSASGASRPRGARAARSWPISTAMAGSRS